MDRLLTGLAIWQLTFIAKFWGHMRLACLNQRLTENRQQCIVLFTQYPQQLHGTISSRIFLKYINKAISLYEFQIYYQEISAVKLAR